MGAKQEKSTEFWFEFRPTRREEKNTIKKWSDRQPRPLPCRLRRKTAAAARMKILRHHSNQNKGKTAFGFFLKKPKAVLLFTQRTKKERFPSGSCRPVIE